MSLFCALGHEFASRIEQHPQSMATVACVKELCCQSVSRCSCGCSGVHPCHSMSSLVMMTLWHSESHGVTLFSASQVKSAFFRFLILLSFWYLPFCSLYFFVLCPCLVASEERLPLNPAGIWASVETSTNGARQAFTDSGVQSYIMFNEGQKKTKRNGSLHL